MDATKPVISEDEYNIGWPIRTGREFESDQREASVSFHNAAPLKMTNLFSGEITDSSGAGTEVPSRRFRFIDI